MSTARSAHAPALDGWLGNSYPGPSVPAPPVPPPWVFVRKIWSPVNSPLRHLNLRGGLILGGMAGRAGKVELSYRLDGPRPGSVRVRAGTELVITLEETGGYAWTAVESLHPTVVRVLRSGRGPKVIAVAVAVASGDAELRWTSSFTGDPHGPPTLLWRLAVTVAS